MIGSSPKFRTLLDEINLVAPANCAVLLRGETGTGKELAARAIHDASGRSQGPFVPLNCAALPGGLLESELFGHERGAFTGAMNRTEGRFKAADRGTLFLDEIGDLPLELQPKLLRVLQEQRFERVGGTRSVNVDVRIISATNQDLWTMARYGKFRADLYYRLDVFPLVLPTLRERVADIPQLVRHFVQLFAQEQSKSIDCIPDEIFDVLKAHDWPGNIRELQNLIERAVIMTPGSTLQLPRELLKRAQSTASLSARTLAEAERDHIVDVLREVGWVIGGTHGAAVRLGLPRTTLISRMCKLGIPRQTGSDSAFEDHRTRFRARHRGQSAACG